MAIAIVMRGVGLAFISLAFLMPGHFLPWASFQSQWVAAFGASLIVLGAASAVAVRDRPLPRPVLAWVALTAATVPWLQWATGQLSFVSDALLPSAYLTAFALAMLGGAVWSAVDRSTWLDGLFAALTLAATVSVALALTQWLSIGVSQLWVVAAPPGARPFANLGQPNHLALLLALGLIGTWRSMGRGQLSGVTSTVLTVWLGLGLVMTQSRTGWLIVALLVGWWAVHRRQLPALTARRVVVGATLFTLLVLSWGMVNETLLVSQASNLNERLQSGPRDLIWRTMWGAIENSPWVGYGFNQVAIGQQAAAIDYAPVHRMLESAHNVVLDAALWAGLPFAALIGLSVAVWLASRIRACRNLDDWSVLAAILAMLTHAMLEYPLEHAYFLLPMGFLMGSFASSSRQSGATAPVRAMAWQLALPTLAMTALLLLVGVEYLRVERASHAVRLALFGVGDTAAAPPPDVKLLDAPREYHRLMLTAARADMSIEELDWMSRVARRHAFPPAMMRYALAAGLNGRADEAALTLRQLCSLHPPVRCDEAREAWRAAQVRWPSLALILAP